MLRSASAEGGGGGDDDGGPRWRGRRRMIRVRIRAWTEARRSVKEGASLAEAMRWEVLEVRERFRSVSFTEWPEVAEAQSVHVSWIEAGGESS